MLAALSVLSEENHFLDHKLEIRSSITQVICRETFLQVYLCMRFWILKSNHPCFETHGKADDVVGNVVNKPTDFVLASMAFIFLTVLPTTPQCTGRGSTLDVRLVPAGFCPTGWQVTDGFRTQRTVGPVPVHLLAFEDKHVTLGRGNGQLSLPGSTPWLCVFPSGLSLPESTAFSGFKRDGGSERQRAHPGCFTNQTKQCPLAPWLGWLGSSLGHWQPL